MKYRYIILTLLLMFLINQPAYSQGSMGSMVEDISDPNHIVKIVINEKIYVGNPFGFDLTIEYIPLENIDVKLTVNNSSSYSQTDDKGELPVFLGKNDELYIEFYYKGEKISSVNHKNFGFVTNPLNDQTYLYEKMSFDFEVKRDWNPLDSTTYNLAYTSVIFLSILLIISLSVLYLHYIKINDIKKPSNKYSDNT